MPVSKLWRPFKLSVKVLIWLVLCKSVDIREDVTHVGVVGAAERRGGVAAVLNAAFTLASAATWNKHKQRFSSFFLREIFKFQLLLNPFQDRYTHAWAPTYTHKNTHTNLYISVIKAFFHKLAQNHYQPHQKASIATFKVLFKDTKTAALSWMQENPEETLRGGRFCIVLNACSC